MSQTIRKAVKAVRPTARSDIQPLVRRLIKTRATRRLVNALYLAMSGRQQEEFYWFFANLFEDSSASVQEGDWKIRFAGKRLVLPLTNQNISLEWASAVAILGHDYDVKRTYEQLIKAGRVKVFFDVGANFGLHSLLFLAHGIETISFEPNPNCHAFQRRLSAMNELTCDIQPVALGEHEGAVSLWYPENLTWFGTTDHSMRDRLSEALNQIEVEQTTLDEFVKRSGRPPELIKIDTEGNELNVLKGSLLTLNEHSPLVIFESWQGLSPRKDLFSFFEQVDYTVASLPLPEKGKAPALDERGFLESEAINFIARPTNNDLAC